MRDYASLFDLLSLDLSEYRIEDFPASDLDFKEVFATMLARSFFKKLAPDEKVSDSASIAALEKFEAINQRMAAPFNGDCHSEHDERLLSYFRSNLQDLLGFRVNGDRNFDLAYVADHFSAGPGASIGCDSESFYTKLFQSRLSSTSDRLISLYRAAVSESTLWASAEKQRFEEFGNDICRGSRLFFVPKTTEIGRTCCTEPVVNMLIQKAIGSYIEERLRLDYGINLSYQPVRNSILAQKGSVDGSLATIDLASASDSMSWSFIQWCLSGSNLLGWIREARCAQAEFPSGEWKDLNMVSSMGNGFTFPLQTALFACMVKAVYQLKGLTLSRNPWNFGVFGDDIVVRSDCYNAMVRLLERCGFEVNDSKSFSHGPFRESCGHDYFRGVNVRGVYIVTLETVPSVYSAINRLNRWSARSGIPLTRTIRFLRRLVPHSEVPFSESDDAGVKVPFKFKKNTRVDNEYNFPYRANVAAPRRRAVPLDKEGSEALNYRSFNADGWALAFLGGYARSVDTRLDSRSFDPENPGFLAKSSDVPIAWVTLREEAGASKRRKVVRKSVPYWDWPGYHAEEFGMSIGCWEAAYAGNCVT